MDREHFRQIYDGTICQIVNGIRKESGRVDFKDNFDGLFEEYLNQKALLKLLLEKDAGNNKTEENLLDRHKVAACITVAIMKMRLLHFNDMDDHNNDYSLTTANRINEQLAFLSGLHIILLFMADDLQIKGKLKNFEFPKTNHESESTYLDSIIRTLYYSNTLSGFHTLLIANIFFLLEEYYKLKCLPT